MAAERLKEPLPEFTDSFSIVLMFTGIDQKICFQQNLVIQAINIAEGMMVPNQVTDPLKHLLIHAGIFIEPPFGAYLVPLAESDNGLQNWKMRVILNKHTHVNRQIYNFPFCFYIIICKDIGCVDLIFRIVCRL